MKPKVKLPESPMNILWFFSILQNILKKRYGIRTPINPAIRMQYVYNPSCRKTPKKPANARKESYAHKPSIPSMRFMALFRNTIMNIVSGQPIRNGIS